MRIAYISDYSPENIHIWSGTPYHVYHALKKKHDIEWFGGGIVNGAIWHHRFLKNKNKFHAENYTKETGDYLSEVINRKGFDIVISCTYHLCVNLKVSIPVIYYSDITFDAFRPWLNNNDTQYHKICRITEQLCLEKVDAVVYSSEWAKHTAIKAYGIEESKLHVIEFGANIPTPFDVLKNQTDYSVCNLVFVGRDPKRKGLVKVLDTYAMLKQSNFNCNLTIIGCDIENKDLYQDVEVYPLLDKAKLEDSKLYDQIMRRSHFLFLPTVFDAFGIVFCEASAYGVPSITTDVAGVSQPIRNGVNGLILPHTSDADKYANVIRDTFLNKDLYQKMCHLSRKEFESRLNWDVWCERITALCNDLTNKHTEENDEFFIPVYVINLKERIERRRHIEQQFANKTEFEMNYIDAIKHPIGAVGLWQSLKKCVNIAIEKGEDIIVICEDDHFFTEHYSKEYFFANVIGAAKQGAELLSGGVSNFRNAVPVSSNRYWIDCFFATQFIVLYKPIFKKILEYEFKDTDAEDLVIPLLSDKCMVVFPFISEQIDFGHSDASPIHNVNPGIVTRMFTQAKMRLNRIQSVRNRFIDL